uniref:Tf2-1-like SH3-like domain-containing protein n=1 Tax=Ananas comosus var. bracteatus TaxID=296719 RepID=A0A6V7PPC7_ANACO|nr:unnamed protein product [Ananas comosus var. bracteatus]
MYSKSANPSGRRDFEEYIISNLKLQVSSPGIDAAPLAALGCQTLVSNVDTTLLQSSGCTLSACPLESEWSVLTDHQSVGESLAYQRNSKIWNPGKLSPQFIGPYEVLERVGPVAYRLALPPNLSGVHNVFHVSVLRKYIHDPAHVLDATPLELRDDLSFEEQPLRIVAHEVKRLRNREIPYVKVLWSNHDEREATWELESALRERYPHLFQMEA